MVKKFVMQPNAGRRIHSPGLGQSIIEAIVGLLLFVLLALFMLDIGTLVMATTINNDMAARAVRVAANQNTLANAKAAVAQLTFPTSGIITSVNQNVAQGATNAGNAKQASTALTVTSTVNVQLPVPVPFLPWQNMQLTTTATAPALLF